VKVIVLRNHNPYSISSASSNRIITLIEGLASLGVEIELMVTRGYQTKHEEIEFGSFGIINGVKYKYISTLVASNFLIKRIDKYIFQPLFSSIKAMKIRKLLLKEPENTIIWPFVSIEHLKAIKKKLPGKIYFAENNEYPDFHKFSKNTFYQKWSVDFAEDFFQKHIFPNLIGMALMTKALIKYYQEFPPPGPKLLHLPMTVDLDRFNFHDEHPPFEGIHKPYIAFVGVMNNQKEGIDILIESFAKIAAEFTRINLYLFGSWHPDLTQNIDLINHYKLKDRVFYKGSIASHQVPSVLMNAELLVLPRPESYQAAGGFPTKLGEYLASGKPVCATRVGEIPDYLEDEKNVFFAEPNSINSFSSAMMRALTNKVKANEVGLRGMEVAEKEFNKSVQAQRLFEFLHTLG